MQVRFTPTRVGTILVPGTPLPTVRGSPPRAWGQFLSAQLIHRQHRFTPTRVGTMSLLSLARVLSVRFTPTRVGTIQVAIKRLPCESVHPHARGDNFLIALVASFVSGSPPRAWGQCKLLDVFGMDERFTPTRVGTIGGDVEIESKVAVHPHARGDNYTQESHPARPCGSPPRAWGQSCR